MICPSEVSPPPDCPSAGLVIVRRLIFTLRRPNRFRNSKRVWIVHFVTEFRQARSVADRRSRRDKAGPIGDDKTAVSLTVVSLIE